MHLLQITDEEVKQKIPDFFNINVKYFNIIHDDVKIGIFGVRKLRKKHKTCDIRLHVFEEHRNKIYYREGLRILLHYPFSLGFDTIFISSKVKSVVTLMGMCSKMGVRYCGIFNNLIWFCLKRKYLL